MIKTTNKLAKAQTGFLYETFPYMNFPFRKTKGDVSITTSVLIAVVLLFLVIIAYFFGLFRTTNPIFDFFKNLPGFENGNDTIDYDPTQEFVVYDEFGSLYPAIRVSYISGCDDEFLFRWDRYLSRAETSIKLESVPSIFCRTALSNGWLTNPKIMSEFQGSKVEDNERNLVIYVMEASSEEEMIKRISDISSNADILIDFPIVRPEYTCDESISVQGEKYCFLEPVSRFPIVENANDAKRQKKAGKIEATEIRQTLLELPEYYIFHNEDSPKSESPLNRTFAFMDIFKYHILADYNPNNCHSYEAITYFKEAERKYNSPLIEQWIINFKYDWSEPSLVQIDNNENTIFIRRKDSFYIKFLCNKESSLSFSGINSYDRIKNLYPNLQRKLRNGEPYP